MNTFSRLSILALCAALSSCATGPSGMSAKDCASADWRALGVQDGQEGAASIRRDQRFAACAGSAPPPDQNAYGAGYADGLALLCTPKGGYEFGLAGKEYLYVCPRPQEPDFIQTYQIGYEEYELKETLRDAQRGLDRSEREMRSAQTDVQRLQSQYNSANTQDRIRLQTDIDRLRRRVFQIQDERAQFENAKRAAEAQLKKYRKGRPAIPGVD
ncbi:MAG: DUF2799 domain-containing protein [Gammaproteobacteria bacterium]